MAWKIAMEDGPTEFTPPIWETRMKLLAPGSWLQSGPFLVVEAIWGVNEQLDFPLFLFITLTFQINKQTKSLGGKKGNLMIRGLLHLPALSGSHMKIRVSHHPSCSWNFLVPGQNPRTLPGYNRLFPGR